MLIRFFRWLAVRFQPTRCTETTALPHITAFDDIERTGQEPASHLIGRFDYLNASGRVQATAIRDQVDAWLADYPAENRPEMIGRLRSRNDILHLGAFFELVLFAFLRRQGFQIVAIEPLLTNGRSPDFLVAAPNGTRFYLEATLATGVDNISAGAERRMREALQAIDDVNSPDFFLHVHTRGVPAQPIAVRRLGRAVQQFIDELDYEQAVQNERQDADSRPTWRHEEHGAQFLIQAVPKNVRRPGSRAIGGRMLPGGVIHPEIPIRSAVQGKAGRYGNLDLPFVIAVNALEEFARVDDAVDALFGTDSVAFDENGTARVTRSPDGAWRGRRGPINTRSSAVLFVERLTAWSVGQRRLRLILNPWARRPLPDLPLGAEVRRVVDDVLVTERGQSLAEIFGLPENWPE